MPDQELSYGEKLVGISFNPGGNEEVNAVKLQFAQIIDVMHELRSRTTNAEVARMCSIAITESQTAQMWAVKAVTWRE